MDAKIAARLAELHTALAEVYRDLAITRPAGSESRVLSLTEAAAKLGMTVAWLSRRANWQRVGGFKGLDRRVHFPLSALDRYITTQNH